MRLLTGRVVAVMVLAVSACGKIDNVQQSAIVHSGQPVAESGQAGKFSPERTELRRLTAAAGLGEKDLEQLLEPEQSIEMAQRKDDGLTKLNESERALYTELVE